MADRGGYTSLRESCASRRNYTPEMSRRARGVELWATLRSLGRSGLADLIERTCRHAQRFAAGLRAAGHEILNDVVINQVLVSFGEPAVTRAVIAKVQEDGACWCGGTEWRGRPAMRISVSSWATTEEDVEMSLAAICRIAEECEEMTPDWKAPARGIPCPGQLDLSEYGHLRPDAAQPPRRRWPATSRGGTNLRAATSLPGSTTWMRSGRRARGW